jgi:exodeoxyribonuclease V alpha subunit
VTSALITSRPELRAYQEAGVFTPADVQTAVAVCRLGGETDDRVLLAAALTVRALRQGSVCVALNDYEQLVADIAAAGPAAAALVWPPGDAVLAELRASPLVTGSDRGPLRPLTLADSDGGPLLYLDRYFRQENTVRDWLSARDQSRPDVDPVRVAALLEELFVSERGTPTPAADRQRLAAAVAATEWTTVLTGGPGTGKTYTVARILALLTRLHGKGLRVALCAPTGKAAATLTEAVAAQAGGLGLDDPPAAATLHRLLGATRAGSAFRFNAANPLPYDVVVVDETSMVSLTLMARLIEALPPCTRLILIGDPDQLTSVDAGAVLADLVCRPVTRPENPLLQQISGADLAPDASGEEQALDDTERAALRRGVVRLQRGRRFDWEISQLADAVRAGQADTALQVLSAGGAVSLLTAGGIGEIQAAVVSAGTDMVMAARGGDAGAALEALRRHRVLCAHRDGPAGRERWAALARDWITGGQRRFGDFYPGQPLLVTANDYDLKVFNGDIGVVIERDGALAAVIERGGSPLVVEPSVLADVQTAYAMTIHRSQGSQYASVSVILPDNESPLLTRELLYTAITRAQQQVRIVGTPEVIAAAVSRQVQRASGLRRRLR